jgi:hypothetical protein
VKIAQFFATGIAAQELARAGGAATVNPGAKSPEVLSLDERAKEREIGRRQADDETAFDQVAETIFMAGNGKTGDEPQKARVARAKQALSKNIRFPKRNGTTVTPEDEAIRIGALQSIAEVLDYLTEKYPGQGQRILENLKSN